jgi:hypothetical protein
MGLLCGKLFYLHFFAISAETKNAGICGAEVINSSDGLGKDLNKNNSVIGAITQQIKIIKLSSLINFFDNSFFIKNNFLYSTLSI